MTVDFQNTDNLRDPDSALGKRLYPIQKHTLNTVEYQSETTFKRECIQCLKDGFPPQDILYWAGIRKFFCVVDDLCIYYSDKINLNEPMFAQHQTITHIAAQEGQTLSLIALINNGADLSLKDDRGNRPVDYARQELKNLELIYEMNQCDKYSQDRYTFYRDRVALLLEEATAEQEKRGHPFINHSKPNPQEYIDSLNSIPTDTEINLKAFQSFLPYVIIPALALIGIKCCESSLSKPPERVQKAVPVMSMSKQQENGGYERQN